MKILLVRLRLVGDVVFTTPAIRAVRRRYPDAHLAYVVEPAAAPVVASNPHLDEIIVVSAASGLARLASDAALARQLRARRFDLAIDFHGGPRGAWLTWASRAPTRIGYAVAGRAWMYTERVDRPRTLRERHSVENQWDLLAPLGIAAPDPRQDPVEMPEDPTARALVDRMLAAQAVSADHRLIIVHVTAGNRFRTWPAGSFVELIVSLVRTDPRHRVLLTSGPSDAGAAGSIARAALEQLDEQERQAVLHNRDFGLAELRALIGQAALFIGGDSGPLHIAATTAAPIVGLYGPTLPVRSAPWRSPDLITESVDVGELPCRPCDQRRCAPGDFRCLTWLTPSAATDAAVRAISRSEPGES